MYIYIDSVCVCVYVYYIYNYICISCTLFVYTVYDSRIYFNMCALLLVYIIYMNIHYHLYLKLGTE